MEAAKTIVKNANSFESIAAAMEWTIFFARTCNDHRTKSLWLAWKCCTSRFWNVWKENTVICTSVTDTIIIIRSCTIKSHGFEYYIAKYFWKCFFFCRRIFQCTTTTGCNMQKKKKVQWKTLSFVDLVFFRIQKKNINFAHKTKLIESGCVQVHSK